MGTRNIIAEFSCSLDENGVFNKYEVVVGSTFTDQYNETLDSAVILLAHVPEEKRLSQINAYVFCRVYDTASESNGVYTFDKTFLVDTWDETEERISFDGENKKIYGYTINLMSETKLLEKWQCPNLSITHNIKNGVSSKKTIFEKICEYMELYVPKVKKSYKIGNVTKWKYSPVIENPGIFQTEVKKALVKDIVSGSSYYEVIHSDDFTGRNFINTNISATIDNPHLHITGYSFTGNHDMRVDYNADTNMRGCSFTITVALKPLNYYDDFIGSNGRYVPRDGYENFYNKFNVEAADLSTNYFTLRQLLTALMQQASCIPTVRKLKLGFLDYKAIPADFALNDDNTINNTTNFVRTSQSSDSYVNTLVNTSSSVLDSENEVVSEVLGFRDPESVLLKQKENLFLTTKFPIYKVEKMEMNFMTASGFATEAQFGFTKASFSAEVVDSTHIKATLRFDALTHIAQDGRVVSDFYFRTTKLRLDSNGVPHAIYNQDSSKTYHVSEITGSSGIYFEYTFEDTSGFSDSYYMFQVSGHAEERSPISVAGETDFTFGASNCSALVGPNLYTVDITPLVKEKQERDLLERNYLALHEVRTIDALSRYVYGTVGYTMGDNKIYGFSDYYEEVEKKGFLSYTYGQTYIEAIYKFLSQNYIANTLVNKFRDMTGIELINGRVINLQLFDPSGQGLIKFTQFTFNIRYKPLNSFNLSFVKSNEPVDIPIEQFNGTESGTVDFDRLSLNQQETVDKIGNPYKTISQRITPEQYALGYMRGGSDFSPTVYKDNGKEYIVFRREYTVGNYKYDINYTASEHAILKDYFTSIRTKYRAYEYVSLANSTLRKEKDVIFVRIAPDYYKGDDKVYFIDGYGTFAFINGANYYGGTISYLKYVCEEAPNHNNDDQIVKNEISQIKSKYGFAIIYEQSDNVSAGPFIGSSTYQTFYDDSASEEDKRLGGVPQTWQKWNLDAYSFKHKVFYTSSLNFFDRDSDILFYNSDEQAMDQIAISAFAPVLERDSKEIKGGSNLFSITNDGYNKDRVFFKDYSERLNHTVQFIYYSPDKSVEWSEDFIANNSFIKNESNVNPDILYVDGTDEIIEGEHFITNAQKIAEGVYVPFYVQAHEGENGEPACIYVDWGHLTRLKLGKKISTEDGGTIVKDWILFRRPDDSEYTYFYVTLNDTKTDYVLTEVNGMLYRRYKVETNTNDRTVVPLYNE